MSPSWCFSSPILLFIYFFTYGQFGIGVDQCGQPGLCINNLFYFTSLSVTQFIFLMKRRKKEERINKLTEV